MEKQIKALNTFKSDNEKLTIRDVIPKNALNNDKARKELNKIKEPEKTFDRENRVYRASEYRYDIRNIQTIKMFDRDIHEGEITLEEANIDQDNLLRDIRNFNQKTNPQLDNNMQEKKLFLKIFINFLKEDN